MKAKSELPATLFKQVHISNLSSQNVKKPELNSPLCFE